MANKQKSGAHGAFPSPDGTCLFRAWAPDRDSVSLKLVSPDKRTVPMDASGRGYFEVTVDDIGPGARYMYVLDEEIERPDPASRSQPDDVHGPSEVVAPDFDWSDEGWNGPELDRYVLYELHIGTFSQEGTFDGAIPHLPKLRELGVTAVEVMPVAEFPGSRNWGYDGVYPYAAESSYGGVPGLKRFVDAAHSAGLAVVLDVVYNHLGPEGNYLGDFGPYFSPSYSTPWGKPINFDGPGSDEVRRYFIDNALYWTGECHIDALRLDAIDAIFDFSARPFLQQLADEVHAAARANGRTVQLIAESALNDPRVVRDREQGGLGMDAHWNDDFHHPLHVALTGERREYYVDFNGLEDLAETLNYNYAYRGRFSEFRGRSHGADPVGVKPHQLVVCAQNHDQVGNRAEGDRLSASLSFEQLKLVAGVVLLSPFLPLLFMGEEYGETAPFPYFVSHTDAELVEAVRKGRAREFADMVGGAENVPDPQSEETFLSAKLNHSMADEGRHGTLWRFHKRLIEIRSQHPTLESDGKVRSELIAGGSVLVLYRGSSGNSVTAAFNFSDLSPVIGTDVVADGARLLIDSSSEEWKGPSKQVKDRFLSPHSFQLFERYAEEQA